MRLEDFTYLLVRQGFEVPWDGSMSNDGGDALCTHTGEVILFPFNAGGNRQRWIFHRLDDGTFNIKNQGGADFGKEYLSYRADGSVIDLYDHDDGSGRQRWMVMGSGIGDQQTIHQTIRIKGVALVDGRAPELKVGGEDEATVCFGQDIYRWQVWLAGLAQNPDAVLTNEQMDYATRAFL